MKKILFTFLFTLLGVAFLATEKAQAQVGNKYYYKKTTPRKGPHNHQWVWTKRRQYVSVGLNVNAMNYFGDIVPKPSFWSTDLRFTRPNIGIFVEKKFRPQFSARLGLNWGRLLSYDEDTADPADSHDFYRYIRNAHFRNDIFELNTTFRWDLMSSERLNKEFYQRPKQFVPYVMGGLAVFYHAPKAQAPTTKIGGGDPDWGADAWTDLQSLGTEGQGRGSYTKYLSNGDSVVRDLGEKYSKVQIAIPLGFGIRKKLSNRIDIAFEFSYRFLLTDYLDDISGNYVDLGVFEDDELAKAFHDRSLEGDRAETLAEMASNGELYRLLNSYTYTGVDGKVYNTFDGFGSDPYIDPSIRGNQNDNDVYMLTGFHLTYIIPPHGVRCPVRFK
ncbi:hypothetical protein Fleli_3021 [Bernardetia litoralis DSM 6794]|uniref:DUF6089 domain-containing protein n=1 Tax=Bernardetia litoralis (strain ATCC 23117 / DSM 6794 / NBRC 15988 / NCIMB 1366 / Fx l1 / Sio-4) TaxID=880071 RepID=I4AN27_BERLS|nr:DUF6089 family protein [Bernardetia litoralis]AFM05362.1 hypothetical protein Fleli_3021 [Bernardetia litoralis DSM 6794]